MSDQELSTFEIEVEEKDQNRLRVRLLKAPDGQGQSGRCLTPNPYRENYLDIASDSDQRLKTLGKKLYNSLFLEPDSNPDDKKYNKIGERFWSYYESLSKKVEANQLCLRLLLDFSAAAGNFEKVLALPWEFLHDDHGFILLEKKISIARQTTGKQRDKVKIEPPMKVLLAYAEPQNLSSFEGEKFLAAMTGEIEQLGLELEQLPNAKLDNFKERIEQGGCHIIHFMGHGEVKPSSAAGLESYIYLESSEYQSLSDSLSAKQLSEWIANAHPTPKLILFNSCQTAVSDQYFERGMAHALLNSGVEAVVAMQANVDPRDAVDFAKAIYQSLKNQQRIDEAVSAGRQQLSKSEQSRQNNFQPSRSKPVVEAPLKKLLGEEINLPNWGLPILLLNGDGWLGQEPPPDRILWQVTDSTEVEMVRIPEGNYYIDRYPVTSSIYSEFAKAQGIHWTINNDHPVTNITFEKAKEFACFTGRYLPTVEEWKMAALSGIPDKEQKYPWGNEYKPCNTLEASLAKTLPVTEEAEKYPHNRNPSGMCGIIGNVAELVVDDQGKPKLCSGSFEQSITSINQSKIVKKTDSPKIGFRCKASWAEVKKRKAENKVEFVEV
jgi:formylglycine-generating enzyme required for sulfatase activity